MNRPELHDVLRRWRALTAARDGDQPSCWWETYVLDLEQLIPFYGLGEDELHLAFNFLFFHGDLDPEQMRPIVEGVERMLPEVAWPVWTGSNHDGKWLATRWAGGDPRARARADDPAGAAGHAVPLLRRRDRAARHAAGSGGRAGPGAAAPATPRRTATPATPRCRGATCRAAGSRGRRAAVAAVRRPAAHNVEAQREDRARPAPGARPDRAAARARRTCRGRYELPAPAGAGPGGAARARRVLNLGGARPVEGVTGRVLVGTDRGRDGPTRAGFAELARARARRGAARERSCLTSCSPARLAGTPRRRPVEPGDPGRFHALFGRDSLITPLQVLPERPDVARATLRALARLQGARHPGRSRSRARSATSSGRGAPLVRGARAGRPTGPFAYYGTSDSTSWFLVLLAATGDRSLAHKPRARARGGGVAARPLDRGGGWFVRRGWGRALPAGLARPSTRRPRTDGGYRRPTARRPRRRSPTSTRRRSRSRRCARSSAVRRGRWAGCRPSCASGSGPTRSRGDGDRGRRRGRARLGLAARLAAVVGRARASSATPVAARLYEPDVLTAYGLRTLAEPIARLRPPELPPRQHLAVRLVAGLGWAARGGPRGGRRARALGVLDRARRARPRARALLVGRPRSPSRLTQPRAGVDGRRPLGARARLGRPAGPGGSSGIGSPSSPMKTPSSSSIRHANSSCSPRCSSTRPA